MSAPDKLAPLAPELEALLAHERGAPDMSAGVQDCVLERLTATLGVPPDGSPPEGGEPGPSDSGPAGGDGAGLEGAGDVLAEGASALADGAGSAVVQSAAAHSATGTLLGVFIQKPALLAATMFALGGATGAVVHRAATQSGDGERVAAEPTLEVVVESVKVDAASPRTDEPEEPVAEDPPSPAKAPAKVATPKPKRKAGTDRALAAERRLIEVARSALARGDVQAAMTEISSHAKLFPRGRLAEERDALRIRALVVKRDLAKAARFAEEFQRRYPRSLFMPMVKSALAGSRNQK